ncbi:uncharacterized protein LOC119095370 isoform X2 [Pollicipes pollicipes]|nr:uncharacterized protein LOC119095370 isoform X2 [Pollicipes pollicipes]
MLWQHSRVDPAKPIAVDDDRRTFETFLRHLHGEEVNLSNNGLTHLITLLKCAHKYQCYRLGTAILSQLSQHCCAESVLHVYKVLQPLPELPANSDPAAPSAPPETDLVESDPEQAEFAKLLLHTFQRCLQVIDNNSVEVLASDPLLALEPQQVLELAQRDSLQARELDIGRAVLRWLRHYSLSFRLDPEQRRQLVLGALRLLTMSPKELKKLELEREGVLTREELERVLEFAHHGTAVLPESIEPYREYWLCRRRGGARSRGVLQRLMERTRGGHGLDERDSVERREAALQRRSRRADKVKMALATGASFIFD